MPGLFSALVLAIGVGWCSGLNLYATVAVLGLLHRFIPEFTLPGTLHVLSSYWVIVPAVVMYVAEFIADKIPVFDTAWDVVHSFIRIPAGAVLAAMAVGDVPLEMQAGVALLGGTLSLGAHTAKTTTRLVSHASGTSPIVTPVASLLEDGLVFTTMAVYTAYPVLSLVLVAGMIMVALVIIIAFWSFARCAWRRVRGCPPGESASAG